MISRPFSCALPQATILLSDTRREALVKMTERPPTGVPTNDNCWQRGFISLKAHHGELSVSLAHTCRMHHRIMMAG